MNQVFTQEVLKMLTFLGIGGMVVMGLLGRFISKLQGSFAPYRKTTIIYLLVAMLCIGLLGFLGAAQGVTSPTVVLIITQIIVLTLGFLHIGYMRKHLKWTNHKYAFWLELIFSLVIAAFGFMLFTILFRLVNKEGYEFLIGASVLLFVIAHFIYHTFIAATQVPHLIYKEWFYPMHVEIDDPDESRLKNMLVISFEFQKNKLAKHFTNFRAKAPADMEFGELFYYFINDYNDRHPNAKIEYASEDGEAFGWIFYLKPKWYTLKTKYIDTDKTFFINNIKENDIIICARV
jgi:hypothetical protein